jgi:hypothetical protein
MRRRERTPAFYWYAFGFGLLFAMPWIALMFAWATQHMDAFDKYVALLVIALLVLIYELIHTFNPR